MQARNLQGSTRIEELHLVWKQTGKKPIELEEEPEIDPLFNECWQWFLKLHNKRQSGMGTNPISWADTKAFFDLNKIEPMDYELMALDIFDSCYLDIASKEIQKQNKTKSKK